MGAIDLDAILARAAKLAEQENRSEEELCGLCQVDVPALIARVMKLEQDLDTCVSFKLWGPTGKLGDYVLVDYYDEDDDWWVVVHKRGENPNAPNTFATREAAIAEAMGLVGIKQIWRWEDK